MAQTIAGLTFNRNGRSIASLSGSLCEASYLSAWWHYSGRERWSLANERCPPLLRWERWFVSAV
ncbi:MAG: hypothetical protein ACTS5A_03775 [Candidatus Hodgkinia cicadicola]